MSACERASCWQKALLVLTSFAAHSLQQNAVACSAAIGACEKAQLQLAKRRKRQLHAASWKRGFPQAAVSRFKPEFWTPASVHANAQHVEGQGCQQADAVPMLCFFLKGVTATRPTAEWTDLTQPARHTAPLRHATAMCVPAEWAEKFWIGCPFYQVGELFGLGSASGEWGAVEACGSEAHNSFRSSWHSTACRYLHNPKPQTLNFWKSGVAKWQSAVAACASRKGRSIRELAAFPRFRRLADLVAWRPNDFGAKAGV